MLAIGFANRFYTLWEITEDTQNLGNGELRIITNHSYIKNISFDKETAIEKYPEAKFDPDLKGKTISWQSVKEVWTNNDVYRFGKYKYSKITDADIEYTAWYWNHINGEHEEYVEEVLKRNGYEIRKFSDGTKYLMSPESLENEKIEDKKKEEVLNILEKNSPFEISFDHNPNYCGYCRIDYTLYHFQQVKENYYQGFEYYLPLINGKQKRIKNKKLIINDYTYNITDNGLINVEILDFEIIK